MKVSQSQLEGSPWKCEGIPEPIRGKSLKVHVFQSQSEGSP